MATKVVKNSDTAKDNGKKLQKRNKLKFFGHHIAGMLMHGNRGSILIKSYRNSLFCSHEIEVTDEGMAISKYCKNRWCPICQRNKMGHMINTYSPRLSECQELWFMTLTRPNVTAPELRGELEIYQTIWREISKTSTYRKAIKRGVIGIRKVEVTYHGQQYLRDGSPDPWYDTYHPHLHILLSDKQLADFILWQWGEHNPTANWDAQDLRRVRSEGGYLEIFKYCTKLIAKDSSGNRFFDSIHMDVIFSALKGRRAYFRIGTTEAWGCEEVTEDDDDQVAVIETDASPAIYRWLECDEFYGYYDVDTGETLTELPKAGRIYDIITASEERMSSATSER